MLNDLLNLIIAMGLVALAWMGLALTATALGCGLARSMGIRSPGDHFPRFWTGIGLLVAVVQIWNFFLPIDLFTLGTAFLLGLIWSRTDLLDFLKYLSGYVGKYPWSTGFAVLFAAWVANRCIGPILYGDTGEYHTAQIAWATQHPLVTGFANLDFFLANNTSCLLLASLIDVGPLHLHSMMIFNGLLTIATMWQAFAAVAETTNLTHNSPLRFFYVALPCILIEFAGTSFSASTDYAAGLLAMQCFPLIFRLANRNTTESTASPNYDLPVTVFLLMTAVCMKQTVVFFAASVTVLVVILFVFRQRSNLSLAAKILGVTFLLSALVLIPWCARSVLMCGYPLFPSTFLPFPVEWRVPKEVIAHYQADISYHTSYLLLDIPNMVSSLQWYIQFFTRSLIKGRVMVIIPTAMILVGLIFLLSKRRYRASLGKGAAVLYISSLISLVIWLQFAPQLRYAFFLFWGLAGLTLGLCIEVVDNLRWRKILARSILLFSLGVGFAILIARFANTYQVEVDQYGTPPDRLYYGPGANLGFHSELFRRDPGIVFTTRHGLSLIVRQGHQFLWDSPLPNTRFFNKNLKLVDPSNIRSGFRIVGEPNDPLHGWGEFKGLPQ